MRLCDRDIIQWLDDGRLTISPRPPVERINGATADVRLASVPGFPGPYRRVY